MESLIELKNQIIKAEENESIDEIDSLKDKYNQIVKDSKLFYRSHGVINYEGYMRLLHNHVTSKKLQNELHNMFKADKDDYIEFYYFHGIGEYVNGYTYNCLCLIETADDYIPIINTGINTSSAFAMEMGENYLCQDNDCDCGDYFDPESGSILTIEDVVSLARTGCRDSLREILSVN